MKKYIPYIVLIIALCAAAIWFVKHQSNGTIDEQEGDFAVRDLKEISKIILTDSEKNKVELTNTNGIWMLNGKYAASEDLTKLLLDAITRVTSLCPVPTAAHDNVIREMLARHTRVEIFDTNNNLLKSYWVGGPSLDGQNTYMLLELDGKPASRPYLTYVPNFKGYLTSRYNSREETWRTRVLFNYTIEEIKSLSLEYPGDQKKSFIITGLNKDSFLLSPLDEKFRLSEPCEQKFIRQYLAFYSSISIETFDNNYAKKDSVLKTPPYCNITITGRDNSVNKVALFYLPLDKRSKTRFDTNGNEMTHDLDHYYASIHDEKDWAIIQYYVFGKLLRTYSDFFFKPH